MGMAHNIISLVVKMIKSDVTVVFVTDLCPPETVKANIAPVSDNVSRDQPVTCCNWTALCFKEISLVSTSIVLAIYTSKIPK